MTVLAIDWDGTLVDGESQEWLPDAAEALHQLARDHTVIVHSCRANWSEGLASIEARLIDIGLPTVTVWTDAGKPVADLYIDDHGCHFNGNWPALLTVIKDATRPENHIALKTTTRPSKPRPIGWS